MARSTDSSRHRRAARVAAVGASALLVASLVMTGVAVASPQRLAVPTSHPDAGSLGLDKPAAIAVAGGNLWIANRASHSVTEVAPDGTLIRTVAAAADGFRGPDAIAASGSHLFVVNGGGSVTELSASDGSLVRIISGAGYGFDQPNSIVVQGADAWVVDGASNAVTEFATGSGALVRVLTNDADSRYTFDTPDAIAIAGDDVWVANAAGGSSSDPSAGSLTEVATATGDFVQRLTDTSFGLEDPKGIAYDGSNLWVSDSATNSVTELTAGGALVQVIGNGSNNANYGFDSPRSVVASARAVYVVSPPGASPMVTKIITATANGQWYECNTNSPDPEFVNPTGIALLGSDIWVVSPGNNSLAELQSSTGSLLNRFE
jgi:hypothetical protein